MIRKTEIIGHRGAKGYAPENTLAGFAKALEMGVDGIELDVHLSADGEIMVIHDETIDRTCNGTGFVKKLTLTQLKQFRIDGTEEIPTLAEVFELTARKAFINIELKVSETVGPTVRLIEQYIQEKRWQYTDFLVSSFDWNALQEVRRLHREIPLGVLTQTDLELAIGFSEFIKAETIHPYFHLLTEANTTQMQQQGFRVFPWTINMPEDIARIKTFNVNGIITDFPDRI